MTKEDFIIKELHKYNIPLELKGKSIKDAILLGYRKAGWNASSHTNMTKRFFPTKPSGDNIFTFLLQRAHAGFCTFCNKVKSSSEFQSRSDDKTKTKSICRNCQYPYKKEVQGTGYLNNSAAKYRADRLSATPPWADLQKIKEIYDNCPDGYHVDHIYPLKAINSCGLHVENNLQYLPSIDNLRKGNKV